MRLIATALVWCVVVADLLLILWIAMTSLRGSSDILKQAFAVPAPPRFDNYARAFEDGGFGPAALNSVVVAVVSSSSPSPSPHPAPTRWRAAARASPPR
ncbi:hypothetical protein ACFQ0M_43625 [Kitasatospora aburaviensis]